MCVFQCGKNPGAIGIIFKLVATNASMHGVEPVAVVVEEVIELIGLYVGPWFCFCFYCTPII